MAPAIYNSRIHPMIRRSRWLPRSAFALRSFFSLFAADLFSASFHGLGRWPFSGGASRLMGMRNLRSRRRRGSVISVMLMWGTFVCICAACARATDWNASERQLAGTIAAATGPGAVSLEVVNVSSLSKQDVETIRRGLISELVPFGVKLVKPEQAAATVKVTLSENAQNYVWVAEIRQGTNAPAVAFVTQARTGVGGLTLEGPAITLRRTPLWSQDERILDIATVEANGVPLYMVVLDSTKVGVYRQQEGRWQLEQALPISHARVWPRDMRGRLFLRKDHLFDAYLPGVFCSSSGAAPLTMTCRESEDAWPLFSEPYAFSAFFTPLRNFFTGTLVPGIRKQSTTASFYSAAPVPKSNYVLWVFMARDGQLHLMDGMTDQVQARPEWGSDIAAVRSTCGSGWQVLATHSGDGGADAVRAFEFPDREPVALSSAVELSGPVTALWSATDGSSVVGVSRSPETGKYEAVRLTVACSQ
jgi:hypothetical protein